MNLKKKTFIAVTVKILFSVSSLHAQVVADTCKPKPVVFFMVLPDLSIIKQPVLPNQLPENYYAKQLPFFCRKELQVQKTVGFPIKFRVGSVEDCDRLEGKNR
jgi:hypothetical protein